jgi:hypothetical protein
MSETLSYDGTPDAVVMESIASDEAESLAIGEALMAEQEALLAGKYKSASELEKAYIELQKKLGSGDTEESESYEDGETDEEPQEESDDPFVDFLLTANDEYSESGKLSEETLEAFSNMSSRELVDAYFRMQEQLPQAEPVSQSRELSPLAGHLKTSPVRRSKHLIHSLKVATQLPSILQFKHFIIVTPTQ